jgi:hypothetical protein
VCLQFDPSGQSTTEIVITANVPSRTTPSLGMPIPETVAMGEMPTSSVIVATGAIDPASTTVPLAVVWATASSVVVEQIRFDPHTNMITEGTTIRFASSGATDLSLVHVAAGIVEPGVMNRPAGGFVVAWATSAGTFAARIADLDGMPVAPGVVRVGDATDHPHAFVDVVSPAAGASTSHARLVAHQGASFVAFPNVCGPPG